MAFSFANWRSQIFPPRPDLPQDLTTIDYMKATAIVLMVIDHVGWLLFPEIDWLRVLGRMCVPLWFFLIGYARARDVPGRWLVAGLILMAASMLVGIPPIPLSVLFTMALIRLTIDPFWRFVAQKPVYFWWIIILLGFFGYATDMLLEYGTMGFLLALNGYVVRYREEVAEKLGAQIPQQLMIVSLVIFGAIECLKFGFPLLQSMVVAAGFIGLYFVMQGFAVKTLPGTGAGAQAPLVRFLGRYTLEIYVIHLLILKGVFGLQKLAVFVIG